MGYEKDEVSTQGSFLQIQILVVDDDSTSLAIVSAMLRTCSYRVVAVKTPLEALATLRLQKYVFDLVVTDLHMPDMNGMQLQKQVEEEFQLPVIIMSADDRESMILKSLEGGAVFYIVKPVTPNDLKNVWQYAVSVKKQKSGIIEEIESVDEVSKKASSEEINSAYSANEKVCFRNSFKNSGRKRRTKDDEDDKAEKKAKVVWISSLHTRFLMAVNHIGLDKAVPKKILELMNVPGLTRENVASHLQKYRLFLKRNAERSAFSANNLLERAIPSGFAFEEPSPMARKIHQDLKQFQAQVRTKPYLSAAAIFKNCDSSPLCISKQEAASAFNSSPLFNPRQEGKPSILRFNFPPSFGSGSSRIHGNNYEFDSRKKMTTTSHPSMKSGNNYAGIRITSDGELIRMAGRITHSNGGMLNYAGFVNSNVNCNVGVSETDNATLDSLLAEGGNSLSSSIFESASHLPLKHTSREEEGLVAPQTLTQQRYCDLGSRDVANFLSYDMLATATSFKGFQNHQQFEEDDLREICFEPIECFAPF